MPKPPLIFLSLLFLFSTSLLHIASSDHPQVNNNSTSSPSALCKKTLYPKLCRSIISSIKSSLSDPYNYGKFSIKQCLKHTKKLSKVIHRYLQKQRNLITHFEANALEDCRELSQLTFDYLGSIGDELKTAKVLNEELVDRVTNQQTCVDGLMVLESDYLQSALGIPLSNATKSYSVSLGLVTNALSRNIKKNKKRKGKDDAT